MNFEIHPLADIFPMMSDSEIADLADDIVEHGQREPIIITRDNLILDGRNRFKACGLAGVAPTFDLYTGSDEDMASFVVSLNLKRRHLNETQRAMVAAKLANMRQGNFSKAANLPVSPVSQSHAAEMLNVSERTVRSAREVLDEGAPELVEAVQHGRVSVSAAADVASLPKHEQAEIVARGEREILEAAKAIRAERAKERAEINASIAAREVVIPDGKYGTIVIDPPWPMQKIERDLYPNQVSFDYPVMSEEELVAFQKVIDAAAADDCHMFMWTTHKFLPMSLRLLEAWGFKYVLTMVWHKPGGFQPFGLPQYNCEFAVYARRGTPTFVDTKAFPCCFQAPRREHSRKPDEFYDLVKRVTHDSRIDIFSREPRDGFAQYGNEADKFDGVAA